MWVSLLLLLGKRVGGVLPVASSRAEFASSLRPHDFRRRMIGELFDHDIG